MALYQRISLDDLKARLTERVGNNTVFFTDREKRYAVNEAITMWNALTGQWIVRVQVPSTGLIFYDLPRQLVSLMRVRTPTALLDQISFFELDNGFAGWQDAPIGTPLYWVPMGLDKFAIYPPIAVGVNLTLEGIQLSPRLGSGGDFIDIQDEEVTRLLEYAQHYLSLKEGGLEFSNTRALLANFMGAAGARNGRLMAAAPFVKYMGLQRDEEQRPGRSTRSAGVRP